MKWPPSRPQLTYANVIATLALFLALGGGAYAASSLPRSSVGTVQLQDGAVTGQKIKGGSLTAGDFAGGQLPAGPQGSTGPQGPGGPQGATGSQGETGAKGEKGDRGPQGARGEAGEEGGRGPRGFQGAPGEEGKAGATGPHGPRGEAGENGTNGQAGPRGEAGPRGPAGDPGERGPRGERGLPGEPGHEGPQGEPGSVRTVTRYGPEVRVTRGPLASFASCRRGEYVTGGGYSFTTRTEGGSFVVRASQPSVVEGITEEEVKGREEELGERGELFGRDEEGNLFVYRAAPEQTTSATGWAVSIEFGREDSKAAYRAYVQCAAP